MGDPFAEAVTLFRAGRLAEARSACLRVPKKHARQADALHLLGVIHAREGNHAKASRSLAASLRIAESAPVHLALGNVHAAEGKYDAALASYDRALALQPGFGDASYNRGNVLRSLGREAEAVASFDAALASDPDNADAWNNRGNALLKQGETARAIDSYRTAIRINPGLASAHLNLGIALGESGKWAEALAALDAAAELDPGRGETMWRIGRVHEHLGRHENALDAFERARALGFGGTDLAVDIGNALAAMGRFEAALAAYDDILAAEPGHAAALNNRGNVLAALRRLDDAIESYQAAIAARPDYVDAHVNLGNCLRALRRFDEAATSYDRALAVTPDAPRALFGHSLVQLSRGRFEPGWRNYEIRWHPDNATTPLRDFAQPLWLGEESLSGATILLHGEQGLGDTLQFCRYAAAVKARGARVILEVQAPLAALLAGLPGTDAVLARGAPLPDFDVHCPLMSLPLAFATGLDTIPGACPYLAPDAELVEDWRRRLGPAERPRVGIAWSGNPRHVSDRLRSLPLARLAPLFAVDADFFVLQKDVTDDDRAAIEATANLTDLSGAFDDFARTAALASLMDVVVTVDTAVAHLAGALAKPVKVMLAYGADWRWLQDRDTSPWYPTARLYRQPAYGDWDSVIERVAADLAAL